MLKRPNGFNPYDCSGRGCGCSCPVTELSFCHPINIAAALLVDASPNFDHDLLRISIGSTHLACAERTWVLFLMPENQA
jgi:hypothetical protein